MFDCVIPTRYARSARRLHRARADPPHPPPLPPRRLPDRHLLRLRAPARAASRAPTCTTCSPRTRSSPRCWPRSTTCASTSASCEGARAAIVAGGYEELAARVPGGLPRRSRRGGRRRGLTGLRARILHSLAPHGAALRHRRAPERRQEHALQRAHRGRHPGRELPLLHDRAEPRRGAVPDRAARGARRHRPLGAGGAGDRRVRGHRGPRARRLARARASATSSWPTSARPTRSLQVVRCFEDPDVVHVDGHARSAARRRDHRDRAGASPTSTPWSGALDRARRAAKTPGKEGEAARAELELLERLLAHVSRPASPRAPSPCPTTQAGAFRELHLLTAKPVLYVANVDEDALARGQRRRRARSSATRSRRGAGAIRLCAKVEAELAELAPGGQRGLPRASSASTSPASTG